MAPIDLLGTQMDWKKAELFTLDKGILTRDPTSLLTLKSPAFDEFSPSRSYKIRGRARNQASVTVNGRRARLDEDGNFAMSISLKEGKNRIKFDVIDAQGSIGTLYRTVTYQP